MIRAKFAFEVIEAGQLPQGFTNRLEDKVKIDSTGDLVQLKGPTASFKIERQQVGELGAILLALGYDSAAFDEESVYHLLDGFGASPERIKQFGHALVELGKYLADE